MVAPIAEGQPGSPRRANAAVAFFMDCYLGLTETFIYEYLANLRRVRPVVIAARTSNLERFPLPAGARLHVSPPARGLAARVVAGAWRRLRGGVPHLERCLRRERVRVLHAHYGPAAVSLLALRPERRPPLVTSFYGYDASMAPVVEEFRDGYGRLFDAGDLFLAEGPAMRARLERLGCPPSKLRIQRIAIDPAKYEPRVPPDPGEGPVWLLQCGRMVPKKGYETTLRALAEARRRDRRLRLRVIGDGPGRRALTALIGDLGLGESVELLGALPHHRFLEELGRAHLYVQPSITGPDGDSEGGAPTTLLEAQASGLPILATRHDDIPAVVADGAGAFLSEPGDVGGLAANMVALAAQPARWADMGRAGRAHVEKRHDVRLLARDLEDLYASLTAGGARR